MEDDLYHQFVTKLSNDFYLAAVGEWSGCDPFGIESTAASVTRPFEVVLDPRGGRVSGRLWGRDDSLRSRARKDRRTRTDFFSLRGVAPGKYILVAKLDDPPSDYYDRDVLARCRAME